MTYILVSKYGKIPCSLICGNALQNIYVIGVSYAFNKHDNTNIMIIEGQLGEKNRS